MMQFLDFDTPARNAALETGIPAAFRYFGNTTGIYAKEGTLSPDLCDSQIDGPDEDGLCFCQSLENYDQFKNRLLKAVA